MAKGGTMDNLAGKFYSWTVINDNIAIKKSDKSFYQYRNTGVPMDMKRFFGIEKMKYGMRKDVVLRYQGIDYSGWLKVDPQNSAKLYWHTNLGNMFQSYDSKDTFPNIRFLKVKDSVFEVDILNESVIEEEKEDPYTTVIIEKEGKKKSVYSIKYERNPKLRKRAIEIHGIRCMICGFDFEQKYGKPGQNYIEVHHIKPLSEIGEEVEINPETDLICVCANCHRIIHRRKDMVYTANEVRQMLVEKESEHK